MLYNVTVAGKVAPGEAPETVKKAIMDLLKIDPEGIERIFSGRPILLKKGVNAGTAEKYRKAIEAAGAVCIIEPMADK